MQEYNFEISESDSWSADVNYSDDSGNAIDLTDYSVIFTMKKFKDLPDSEASILKTLTILDQGTNKGKANLSLISTDTVLEVGDYYYDFKLKDSSGDIVKIGPKGIFTIDWKASD